MYFRRRAGLSPFVGWAKWRSWFAYGHGLRRHFVHPAIRNLLCEIAKAVIKTNSQFKGFVRAF